MRSHSVTTCGGGQNGSSVHKLDAATSPGVCQIDLSKVEPSTLILQVLSEDPKTWQARVASADQFSWYLKA